mmetsp:Transcript_33904/g.85815  ORF Transcript_33904/g.85815 Transcript_33904/m.85815 type:complete len:216 (-) Transcript_33904:678-1325(-)
MQLSHRRYSLTELIYKCQKQEPQGPQTTGCKNPHSQNCWTTFAQPGHQSARRALTLRGSNGSHSLSCQLPPLAAQNWTLLLQCRAAHGAARSGVGDRISWYSRHVLAAEIEAEALVDHRLCTGRSPAAALVHLDLVDLAGGSAVILNRGRAVIINLLPVLLQVVPAARLNTRDLVHSVLQGPEEPSLVKHGVPPARNDGVVRLEGRQVVGAMHLA